jgi:hypothetical protein
MRGWRSLIGCTWSSGEPRMSLSSTSETFSTPPADALSRMVS